MVATAGYVGAVKHLPPGAMLVLPDVTWEEYEQVLKALRPWPGHRVSYNEGRLLVVSPLAEHETCARLFDGLLTEIRRELGLEVLPLGATTFKSKAKRRGVEPDSCYYIQNATRMIGKLDVDIATDPPPDLVVEVDLTNDSVEKLPVYAVFGVPEIWRYRRRRTVIYHLRGGAYIEAAASHAFPFLAGAVITQHVEMGKKFGLGRAVDACRDWVRAHKPGV